MPKEVVQLGEAWEAKMANYLCFSMLCNLRAIPAPPGAWIFVDLVVAEWTRPTHLSGICIL